MLFFSPGKLKVVAEWLAIPLHEFISAIHKVVTMEEYRRLAMVKITFIYAVYVAIAVLVFVVSFFDGRLRLKAQPKAAADVKPDLLASQISIKIPSLPPSAESMKKGYGDSPGQTQKPSDDFLIDNRRCQPGEPSAIKHQDVESELEDSFGLLADFLSRKAAEEAENTGFRCPETLFQGGTDYQKLLLALHDCPVPDA